MSDTSTLTDALAAWPKSGPWSAPTLAAARLVRKTETLEQADEVSRKVSEFLTKPDAMGWIETTDSSDIVLSGASLKAKAVILNAELVAGDGNESLHLRHGDGQWWATHFTEAVPNADADADADSEILCCDESRYVCADPTIASLVYRRYWKAEPDGRLMLVTARLFLVDPAKPSRKD